LLELFKCNQDQKAPIPTDLAEAYFEFQESMETGSNQNAIAAFKQLLEIEETRNQESWKHLCKDWKTNPNKEKLLSKLQAFSQNTKYLASLRNDLKRKWDLP
jgi:hypothetical protein